MNKIFLSGRLTADPEMRKTQSGVDVCNFTIAVPRPGTKREDNQSDFFRCVVWGGKDGPGRAGVIQKFFHKGDGIILNGVMQTNKYQDKETGKNVTGYDVKVDDFEFPMARRQDTAPAAQPAQAGTDNGGMVQVDESEPLPF